MCSFPRLLHSLSQKTHSTTETLHRDQSEDVFGSTSSTALVFFVFFPPLAKMLPELVCWSIASLMILLPADVTSSAQDMNRE